MKLNLLSPLPHALLIAVFSSTTPAAVAESDTSQTLLAESTQKPSQINRATQAPPAKPPAHKQSNIVSAPLPKTATRANSGRPVAAIPKTTPKPAPPRVDASMASASQPIATPAIPGLPAGKVLWTTTADGFQKAKTYKRFIIADIYTDWCGWCKRMDKETFHNESVEQYLSTNFIGMKVDAEDKGPGEALAKKYAVDGYPTILFFDANGNFKDRFVGYAGPNEFPKIADKVLRGEKIK